MVDRYPHYTMATPQKNAPGKIFILGALIVGESFYINSLFNEEFRLKADQLSAIYTGLGIAGLVATYWHQREASESANREHHDILSAMKKQAEIAVYTAKLNAKIAYRTRCQTDLDSPLRMISGATALNKMIGDLDRQINDMVDNFPS